MKKTVQKQKNEIKLELIYLVKKIPYHIYTLKQTFFKKVDLLL